MIKDITPQEFLARRTAGSDMVLLDVREAWEIELAPVPSPLVHIPMGQIADRIAELDPTKETMVICRSGGRSMEVARFLSSHGFASVSNVTGGILKWSRDIDPTIPQY
jgi:rhodanese-related sulfurtransferase